MDVTQGSPAPDNPPARVPRSRRHRWLIVAFVLAIVSLGTWWNWPRGDARFVGKWRNSNGRELSLWSSGAGTQDITFMDNSAGKMRLNWRVENGQLCFGGSHAAWTIPHVIRLQRLMKWVTGTTFYSGDMKYDILEVTHDQIRLRGSGPRGPEDEVLTRIPE